MSRYYFMINQNYPNTFGVTGLTHLTDCLFFHDCQTIGRMTSPSQKNSLMSLRQDQLLLIGLNQNVSINKIDNIFRSKLEYLEGHSEYLKYVYYTVIPKNQRHFYRTM